MQLTHLTDEALDQQTIRLVRSERELLVEILHHLKEVETRRLYSKHRLPSLFEYATKRLGYSEDQACRRISAMRLLKEVPAIEEKIENGKLTLTHLSKAQSVFRKEKKARRDRTPEQKLDLLTHLENTSMSEADRAIKAKAFVEITDQKAPITFDSFDEPLQKKLRRLLDVKARTRPDLDVVGLIDLLADLGLEKWDKLEAAKRVDSKKSARVDKQGAQTIQQNDAVVPALIRVKVIDDGAQEQIESVRASRASKSADRNSSQRRPYYPSAIRHTLYMKHAGRCCQCGGSRNLEIDHIVPFAKGGSSELANLRLLCRSCNQRAAIEKFGNEKMSRYLRSPSLEYAS
jgi:5-methylcytosine-specific restriction endonuclease McrA